MLIEGINPELLWFIVGLVFIVAELMMPGFIIFFFGIGAWMTALGAGLGILPSFNLQLVTFLLSSGLSLALFRKQGKKYFEGKVSGKLEPGQDLEDIRGQRAVVIAPIQPNAVGGKVEYHGTVWQASSTVAIENGVEVEITERKNLVLHVKPLA